MALSAIAATYVPEEAWKIMLELAERGNPNKQDADRHAKLLDTGVCTKLLSIAPLFLGSKRARRRVKFVASDVDLSRHSGRKIAKN